MNKFTNCIYFLSHPIAYDIKSSDGNIIQTYKIGSSKCLSKRMLSYITYYPIDKNVVGYFYIKNYDCYTLDDDIKNDFDSKRVKLNGGTEYYFNLTIDKLKEYFDFRQIKYDFYDDDDYKHYFCLTNAKLINRHQKIHNKILDKILDKIFNKISDDILDNISNEQLDDKLNEMLDILDKKLDESFNYVLNKSSYKSLDESFNELIDEPINDLSNESINEPNIFIRSLRTLFNDLTIDDNTFIVQFNVLFCDYIVLKEWQSELVIRFRKFILNSNNLNLSDMVDYTNKSAICIAPTGCGKSFMIRFLTIFCYILIKSNDVLIMNKRKEIFDMTFVRETNEWIEYFNLPIRIINLINNDKADINVFENKSQNMSNIYIINNDKFISSKRYLNYETFDWSKTKIKLIILDECHWSGSDKFNKFLSFVKTNIVDKIFGLSATPVRVAEPNKLKTLSIFKISDTDTFNILYVREYLRSIKEGDRVQNKWMPIPIKSSDIDIHLLDELTDELTDDLTNELTNELTDDLTNKLTDNLIDGLTDNLTDGLTNNLIDDLTSDLTNNTNIISINKKCFIGELNKNGVESCLNWLNNFIVNSISKKGILFFCSKNGIRTHNDDHLKSKYAGLLGFFNYVNEHIGSNIKSIRWSNLSNIKFIPTYSDQTKITDNNLDIFKLLEANTILLAIGRATEGYDDPPVDFCFNLYITNNTNTLLDQQKEGRSSRAYTYSNGITKKYGYYGFLINTDTSYYIDILIKRLGNWVRYVGEFTKNTNKTHTNIKFSNDDITTEIVSDADNLLSYIDQLIDINLLNTIELSDIKDKIIAYSSDIGINSTTKQIGQYIRRINKIRLSNNLELIDTEAKYMTYATNNNLPTEINPNDFSYNWIKFLRPDYEELIKKYYTIDELKKLKIRNYNDYEAKQLSDIKIPTIEQINNGIYNESDQYFNLAKTFIIIRKKR